MTNPSSPSPPFLDLLRGSLPETRGAALLSVHAPSQRVVVVTKKKQLLTFAWQGGGGDGNSGGGGGRGYGAPSMPLARLANDAPGAEFTCVLPDLPQCVCLCGSGAESASMAIQIR